MRKAEKSAELGATMDMLVEREEKQEQIRKKYKDRLKASKEKLNESRKTSHERG